MKIAQRIMQLAESATLAVTAKAAKLKAEGVDVISFAAGEPDFDTPDGIKQAGVDAIWAGRTRYSKPASGSLEVKQAICGKFSRENGLTYTPSQVLATSGGKMAVYLAMQSIIDPGDEVVIPKPYWVSYPEIVKLAGGVNVFVQGDESDDFKLTPHQLATVITEKTRALIFNSPSNPSGVTYTPDEVRTLARVCRGHDLWVISDEIYDRLLYDGQKTLSFAAADDDAYARTITLNSASKTFAMTGWRTAYAAGPEIVIRAMAKLQSQTTSGCVTFNQVALVAALTDGQADVETMRSAFEERSHCMHRLLEAIPSVRCPRPTGAFYCFPNVSGCFTKVGVSGSVAFAKLLLDEARVAVVPGVAFGMDNHVRLSFATSLEQIETGLARITKVVG